MTSNNIIEYNWPKIDIPLVTVSRFLIERLRFHDNKTFLIENETKNTFTYNEVANHSLRMAQVFTSNGLKEGQNFGVCGHNSYEFICTLFGGLIVGGVAVLIDGNTSLEKISLIIKERDIKLMTITTRYQKSMSTKSLKKYCKGLKTIVSFSEESDVRTQTDDKYVNFRNSINSYKTSNESNIGIIKSINPKLKNCLILETSGADKLSNSKCCIITDFNLISQLSISSLPLTGFNWNDRDIVANTTSFCHINGIIQLFSSLTSGSQLVIFANNCNLNIFHLAKAIEKWKISASMLTPFTIIELIKEDLNFNMDSLKKVICTAASMPKNIASKFVNKFLIDDFRQAYGMTEMCGFATMEPIGSHEYETVGVPLPLTQIKIVDTDSDVVLSAGQIGEVCIKSPQLFKGYLMSRDDEENEDISDIVDNEGWFHSSDIGYYDHNRKLQIVDQIKDFIQFRGLHISPTALEAILLSHFAVKEVAIFSTSHKTDGQIPTALVVLHSNQINDSKMVEDLTDYINDHLHKQNMSLSGGLFIVDEIPKTISGKINRTSLKHYVKETIKEMNVNNKYYIMNGNNQIPKTL